MVSIPELISHSRSNPKIELLFRLAGKNQSARRLICPSIEGARDSQVSIEKKYFLTPIQGGGD